MGCKMKLKDPISMMTNEDMIVHILNNLTEYYKVQLSKLEDMLGSMMASLTIDDIRVELQLQYTCMTAKKKQNTKMKILNQKRQLQNLENLMGLFWKDQTQCHSVLP